MRPASAKNKGRRLQQHVRDVLLRVFRLEEGDVESRPMGSGGTDLMLSAKARREIGVSFECKNTVGTPSLAQLRQSQYNKTANTIASVVWKPKGAKYKECLIIFDFEELMGWIKELKDNVK